MRIEQLLHLCTAADTGSINAAAEKMYMSHQGLNASLKSLEKEIGATLFVTSSQGILLTQEGEIIVENAKEILRLVDEMKQSVDDLSAVKEEFISVSTAPAVTECFFHNVFQKVSSNYPSMFVDLKEQSPFQCIKSVKNKEAQLAVCGVQFPLLEKLGMSQMFSSEIAFEPIYEFSLSILVSINHPLARYDSVSLEKLIDYPFVFSGTNPLEEDLNYLWLKMYGEPIVKYNTSYINIYRNVIKDGSAIGFGPESNIFGIDFRGIKQIQISDKEALHTVGYLHNAEMPVTRSMKIIMNELECLCRKS